MLLIQCCHQIHNFGVTNARGRGSTVVRMGSGYENYIEKASTGE